MKGIKQSFNSIALLILFLPYFHFTQDQVDLNWKLKNQFILPAEATSIAFSTNGSLIAVGHRGGTVTVWNKDTGLLVHSFVAGHKDISAMVFTRDGDKLVTVDEEHGARIWNLIDWKQVSAIDRLAGPVAVSPDGQWLAAQDNGIWLWDLKTTKRVKRLTKPDVEGVKTMGFTADGKYVVSAYNYSPFLISIDTGENTQIPIKTKATPLKIQSTRNNQVAISVGPLEDDNAISHTARPSQTGNLIAIGRGWYGKPEFVDLWDNASGKRIGRYKSEEGGVFAIFSYDNSLLAVQSPSALTIWTVSKGQRVGTMKCSGPAEFSPRVKELALTCSTKLLLYGW